MKCLRVFLLAAIAGIAIATTLPAEEVSDRQAQDRTAPDYPGKRGTTTRNIALTQADLAIKQFYRVHERWPNSWQEVRDSQIFQVDLMGRQMQVIDPDDRKVDFKWDVVYEPGSSPRLHTLLGDGKVKSYVIKRPATYQEWLPNVEKQHPTFDADYHLSDKKRLALVSVMVQLQSFSFVEYFDKHKVWPKSVDAVLAEKCAPITSSSINPLTGKPFRFDGSPNDILVMASDHAITLVPIDHLGNRPPIYCSF